MPIYMDKHIEPGITLAEATEAHRLDIAIQDQYNCKTMTFWLDEERGCAFCLIEAPEEQAVRDLHNDAHGLIPHEIIEVDKRLVMAFLGRINDPEPDPGIGTGTGEAADEHTVFYDPAYRAILISRLREAALIPSKYGKRKAQELYRVYGKIAEQAFAEHRGREVNHSGDSYMASFVSVSNAMNCAAEIHRQLETYNRRSENKLYAAIGISGGDPVSGKNDLFGEAIQLAGRLCYLSAGRGEIMVSSEIMERFGTNRLQILSEDHRLASLNPAEEQFLTRLMDIVDEAWQQPEFTLKDLCKKIGLSRSQLYRNLTALTGKSFVDFMKEYRLKQALKLIEKNHDSITQVAFGTGFNNPSYFSKCFRERFGMLPSEYAKTVG